IDSSLERLQGQGYLTITPHFDEDGSQDRNRYTVYFQPLPPEQRQYRVKLNPQVVGGATDCTGGGGATDCSPGGATDCTGPVQQTAPHKRKKPKRKEEEGKDPGSFADAQEPAG